MELTSSVNDLSTLGWNDKISSIRLIPLVPEVYQPKRKLSKEEERAILGEVIDDLKRNLSYFPEKFSNSLFFYKRSDIKILSNIDLDLNVSYFKRIEDWAYVEVEAKNYLFKGIALFYKVNDQWEVKEIVNPDYVVCNNIDEGIDILSWLYSKITQKYQNLPQNKFNK